MLKKEFLTKTWHGLCCTRSRGFSGKGGLPCFLLHICSYVFLDGSGSYDDDGDDITYSWSFVSRPANSLAFLNDDNTTTPNFTADANGEYVLQLTVSDPWSMPVADSVVISFNNVAPVADAGVNQSVVMGEVVSLIGSNSADANLDQLSFAWNIVSRPEGSAATIVNPTAAYAVFTADLAGGYIVELKVNDGLVDSQPDTCSVVAITFQDATTDALQDASNIINSFDVGVFNNKNMGNTLTNKLNAVLSNIVQGRYQEAHDQLLNDILKKTDGCATSGAPDKTDWIQDCASQGQVYSLIIEAVRYLENM